MNYMKIKKSIVMKFIKIIEGILLETIQETQMSQQEK